MINEILFWAKLVLMVIIVISTTGVITYLYKHDVTENVKRKYGEIRNGRAEAARKDIGKKLSYDAMNEMLLRKGIKFRMGDNFSPFDYTLLRLLVALLFGLLGLFLDPMLTVAGVVLGYVLVPAYFDQVNKDDNADMMDDMASVFAIVSLQLRNGMYIADVIYECFLDTEHPRLKKALQELSVEIEKFGSVTAAAVSFRSKFENSYIDMFAKTLEQTEETGKAATLFKDLEGQIEKIGEAIAIKEEQKVDNGAFRFHTFVFLGAMLFVVYAMVQLFIQSV